MKIIELFINPEIEEGGVDAISLVDRPAHESNFLMFNEDVITPTTEKEYTYISEIFTEDEQIDLVKTINELGEPIGTLEKEGFKIIAIQNVHSFNDEKLSNQKFEITSTPNTESVDDTTEYRVRYKYVGPRDDKNRKFCAEMLRYKRVFRFEDIEKMTDDCANEDFGCYSLFEFRGSYNCRHLWVKVLYRRQGAITGNARPIDEEPAPWNQPSTKVNQSADTFVKEEFGILSIVDGQPLFSNKEDAIKLAQLIGCEGYHEHEIGDTIGFMACRTHQFKSFDDYPKAAKENACKARKYKDENPDVSCGTNIGWVRSSQLCNGEPISEETIARMSAFRRHQGNALKQKSYDEGCALLMWDAWGGTEGIDWAERKLKQLREEMDLENACWPGYVAIGTKEVDGKTVPNCVPEKEMDSLSGIGGTTGCGCYDIDTTGLSPYVDQIGKSGVTEESVFKQTFSYDDEKMEITGAIIIPNKMIIRRNPINDEIYYVFFSIDTVKQLSERFMKNKLTDQANLDHTDKMAHGTFVSESWLVVDPLNDKSAALGLNYPTGTWVGTMKVDNRELWTKIKNGEYNGYSIEGYFNERVVFN